MNVPRLPCVPSRKNPRVFGPVLGVSHKEPADFRTNQREINPGKLLKRAVVCRLFARPQSRNGIAAVIDVQYKPGAPSASALMFSQIFVRFGDADELAFSAWLPGELSDSALLFTSRVPFSAIAYYPTNPPAVVQNAYVATPALNDVLRVPAVPDFRAQKEVRIVPVPAIFSVAERQINRITAGTARGQTIDVRPPIKREDAFSYLDWSPASWQNLGPPIPLTFHLATLYDPVPEAFLDIQADYYPQAGMAWIKGETTGSGHMNPRWANITPELAQAIAPLLHGSNSSGDASPGFGARLPFVFVAFGAVIALGMLWASAYLNSRKPSRGHSQV